MVVPICNQPVPSFLNTLYKPVELPGKGVERAFQLRVAKPKDGVAVSNMEFKVDDGVGDGWDELGHPE